MSQRRISAKLSTTTTLVRLAGWLMQLADSMLLAATVVRTHEVFCFLEGVLHCIRLSCSVADLLCDTDTVRPSPGDPKPAAAAASMPEPRTEAPKRPREEDVLPDPKQTKISFEAPKPESRGLMKTADAMQQVAADEPAQPAATEELPSTTPMDAE